jgi:hypothetical protein
MAIFVTLCTRRDKRTPLSEKQSFDVIRRGGPDGGDGYREPPGEVDLNAPVIGLDQRTRSE